METEETLDFLRLDLKTLDNWRNALKVYSFSFFNLVNFLMFLTNSRLENFRTYFKDSWYMMSNLKFLLRNFVLFFGEWDFIMSFNWSYPRRCWAPADKQGFDGAFCNINQSKNQKRNSRCIDWIILHSDLVIALKWKRNFDDAVCI